MMTRDENDKKVLFFIPNVEIKDQELTYQKYANVCRSIVENKRIYSIEFEHNSIIWTATVGEKLKGIKKCSRKRKGKIETWKEDVGDHATVMAIFLGSLTYMVVTNSDVKSGIFSKWENPFMACSPEHVINIKYFDSK